MKKRAQTNSRSSDLVPNSKNHKGNPWALRRVLLAAILLAGLMVALFRSATNPPKFEQAKKAAVHTTQSTPAVNAFRKSPITARSSLGLKKGDRLVYRFHQDRSVNLQGSAVAGLVTQGAANQMGALTVKQRGNLVVDVYDETPVGWLVTFAVENASVQTSSGSTAAPSDGSEIGLRLEVLAVIQKSGRISQMTAQPQASSETLNHWRDILSRWQIILPTNPSASRWTQEEEDATGKYAAAYTRDFARTPAMVIKQKLRYLSLGSSPSALAARATVSNAASIQLDPYQTHIEGHEQLTIAAPEVGSSITSESHYEFHIESATKVSEVEQIGALITRRFEAGSIPFSWVTKDAREKSVTTVDIEGTTIEEQIAGLEQLLAAGMGRTPSEVKILEKIVALIKKDDSSVTAIVSRLSEPSQVKNTELASALIGMLGAAGTPKAQETLIGIVNTPEWPLQHREMAIFSFAQVTEPAPQVDVWLRQLHKEGADLSNNALLIMAAMGDRVRELDPERHQHIADYIVAAANAPGLDLNGKVVVLDALGNLGTKEVSSVVRDALAGDEPLLREKALSSLKRVTDAAAYWLIRDALQTDSSEKVRAVAAGVLADAPWTGGIDDLSHAVLTDKSESVRIAVVESLGQLLESHPEVSRLLQQVAKQDQSLDVRTAAAEALQSRDGFVAPQPSGKTP